MTMQKEWIEYCVDVAEFDGDIDIDEVIEFFTKAKADGATYVSWRGGGDNFGEPCQAECYFSKQESDEEYQQRVKRAEEEERLNKQRMEILERGQYERLKKKYGN